MAAGKPHYLTNGKLYKGATHKMSDGTLHTGAKHSKSSQVLTHSKPKKQNIMSNYGKGK